MKKHTKESAIAIIVECAQRYKEELDGKSLLFICLDKHRKTILFEFSFCGNNFMHLTGVKAPKNKLHDDESADERLYANDFYQKCLNHKLSPEDFDFAEDGTTYLKLEVLPGVVYKNLRAKMIGDFDSVRPLLYTEKIAGSTSACMGFTFDQAKGKYVPSTILKEDIRNITKNTLQVVAVYRKMSDALKYEEMTYRAKNGYSDIEFPEEFAYLKTETV